MKIVDKKDNSNTNNNNNINNFTFNTINIMNNNNNNQQEDMLAKFTTNNPFTLDKMSKGFETAPNALKNYNFQFKDANSENQSNSN